MPGFDIENLLEFKPCRKWCLKCLALWENFIWESVPLEEFMKHKPNPESDYNGFLIEDGVLICKICGVKYTDSTHASVFAVTEFVKELIGLPLDNVNNIVIHASRLASICKKMRTQKEEY